MTMITGLLNMNAAMNELSKCTHSVHNLTICFDTLHYVRRPIMEAK